MADDCAIDPGALRCNAHTFDPGLLRAYDMRGVWGQNLGLRDAYSVGRSFATCVRRAGGRCVAVGYDGRISSPALESALVLGLCDGGIAVRRIGLCPTPLLYYAVASSDEVHGGIEVTGSHNPKDHNGFKMDLGGQPFFGDDIVELGRMAATGDWCGGRLSGAVEQADVSGAYITRILHALDGIDRAGIEHLRIGWDTGNGAAGPLVERLVRHLPGTHVLFYTAVDGHFPHHHPDPSDAANLGDLIAAVAAGTIDFGFAFDGDGDRLGVVDGRGRILWGDQILLILARDLLQRRPGALIMADVKASQVLFDTVAALGGTALMAPTGHSLIKSGMKLTGAVLAGEMTGHLFFADDFYGHDDALYGALRLLAATARLGQSLTALRDAMPETHSTPELRFAVQDIDAHAAVAAVIAALQADGEAFAAIDGARVTTPDGWWLLRASNTESLLTARAESLTEAGLARLLDALDRRLSHIGIRR
ncbi:phosphoglucomutase/phosphomannomutase PgmG [Novosphingobium sp.]|uniref:phosphoglucomutase/phosphomannomutase PgmG n=1 Tax=Novosphingobium sp. TaxID=1874826 RepID=UPI0033400854